MLYLVAVGTGPVGTGPVGAGSTAVGGKDAVQGSPEGEAGLGSPAEGAGLHSPGEAGLQAAHKGCRAGRSSPVAAVAVAAGWDTEGLRKEVAAGYSCLGVVGEQEAAELKKFRAVMTISGVHKLE